jgi:hypothetical protein
MGQASSVDDCILVVRGQYFPLTFLSFDQSRYSEDGICATAKWGGQGVLGDVWVEALIMFDCDKEYRAAKSAAETTGSGTASRYYAVPVHQYYHDDAEEGVVPGIVLRSLVSQNSRFQRYAMFRSSESHYEEYIWITDRAPLSDTDPGVDIHIV